VGIYETYEIVRENSRIGYIITYGVDIAGYSKKIYMHRAVVPYFLEAQTRAVQACPDFRLTRIGCFCPRFQRHNPSRPLSTHTYGIAFDLDPPQNKAFRRAGSDPLPFEIGWNEYSTLPRGLVEAWESVGFVWGGRWGNGPDGGFCDPMHFQLAKVR